MAETSTDAKLAWTDETRFQFLLRIVAQLQRSGQSIKWNEINMPGRTAKSLQHQWTKIKAQVAELEKAPGETSTPTKAKGKGAGAKRKATAQERLTPEAAPEKKRQRTRLPDSPSPPIKKEERDDE